MKIEYLGHSCFRLDDELVIDPIKDVHKLISNIAKKYHLSYRPHIHVDSVIGWVYLFFKNYDYKANPLEIGEKNPKA